MATKLLLVEDVEDLGRSGDIVNVRPGYARNFLLPQGFAVIADRSALRMQARLQEERRKKAILDKEAAEGQKNALEGIVIETIVKVDHEGHMYGSVSVVDVMHLLEEQAKITLEKRAILLKHPIKELGVHEIKVKLKEGVAASFTLKIVPEEVRGSTAEPAKQEAPEKGI
jgi:large subunit ribosomal protein L9